MSSPPSAKPSSAERPAEAKTSPKRRRLILAWFFVVLWAGVIWQLGSDNFSMTQTRASFWWPIIEWVIGDVDAVTRWKVHIWIRKSAHFIEYGILALLTFRAALLSVNKNRLATAGWSALFIVLALASADEARQAFSPVRTGSPYDVLIDLSGGVIVVLGLVLISRRMRREGRSVQATSDATSPAAAPAEAP